MSNALGYRKDHYFHGSENGLFGLLIGAVLTFERRNVIYFI